MPGVDPARNTIQDDETAMDPQHSPPTRITRRNFVKAAGALSASIAVSGTRAGPVGGPAPEPGARARRADRPRVGCVSWCFHGFGAGVDPAPAVETVGEIGFEGIELILNARRDLDDVWTEAKIDEIRRLLEKHDLQVSQFVIFQPVVAGLSSLDPKEREESLEYFEAGCKLGRKLDAPIVNVVAQWPRELKGPRGYLPRYYELKNARRGEKFHIDIAPGFDWDRIWNQYIETTRACLERAKAHGLKFTIEHHTHCIIPDATSFLRLWDAVRDDDLGYNLDTGWTLCQREYPPLAIHKVRHHLMNLHVRDIDGLMRSFVPIGDGVMDFQAIADTLRTVGFQGFLSLEQDKYPSDMKAVCRRYLEMMKRYLAG